MNVRENFSKPGSAGEPLRLTVLGCWSPYPKAGGACSGYLLSYKNVNVLLECGNGVFARLASMADFRALDAVVVSHLHPDHCADIFCLRHAVEYARRTGRMEQRLKLFLPGEPAQRFNELYKLREAFDVVCIDNLPGSSTKRVQVGCLELEFFSVKHKIRSYAAALKVNGRKCLVFSSDTGYFEQLDAFVSGADFFLCEASGLNEDLEYLGEFHLTARQAGKLAAKAGVRQLAITHFFPEYDTRQLLAQAREGYEEECREGRGECGGKDLSASRCVISVQEGETYFIENGGLNCAESGR